MQYSNLLVIGGLAVAFWFLAIRPQQQRAKQTQDMLSTLAPGQEIVTIGGIYATVVELGDRVRVRVVDGSELEIDRRAVSRIIPPRTEDAEELAEDSATEDAATESAEGTRADA